MCPWTVVVKADVKVWGKNTQCLVETQRTARVAQPWGLLPVGPGALTSVWLPGRTQRMEIKLLDNWVFALILWSPGSAMLVRKAFSLQIQVNIQPLIHSACLGSIHFTVVFLSPSVSSLTGCLSLWGHQTVGDLRQSRFYHLTLGTQKAFVFDHFLVNI